MLKVRSKNVNSEVLLSTEGTVYLHRHYIFHFLGFMYVKTTHNICNNISRYGNTNIYSKV